MKKTIVEDWEFDVAVLSCGPCRMGYEAGDRFACQYECPAHFCPKTMAQLHTLCEVARSGGDYRKLGGHSRNEIEFTCADGVVKFRLCARYIGI